MTNPPSDPTSRPCECDYIVNSGPTPYYLPDGCEHWPPCTGAYYPTNYPNTLYYPCSCNPAAQDSCFHPATPPSTIQQPGPTITPVWYCVSP